MSRLHLSVGRWFIVLGTVAVVSVLFIGWWRFVSVNSPEVRAAKSLMMISVAISSYYEDHGSFPPAFIADETGKPKHSWRVLLLPYLGYDDLYKRYNFDQPWDGPDNRAIADEVCDIYGSAIGPGGGTLTRFLAVVGPQTAWPGPHGVRRQDITDRLSETIVVLDCVASDIKWTEPRDLAFGDALRLKGAGNCLRMARDRPQGVLCLNALGEVGRLPKCFSPDLLKSLLTIRGGEKITAKSPFWPSETDLGR